MTLNEWINSDLGKEIWTKKYCYNNESFDEWLDRISNNNTEIKELIARKKFLFGGRILASRGLSQNGKKISLSNCYVIPPPEDNLESIFDTAKKLARTYSYGGGCGVNLSRLSPRGAVVNNAARSTSGCVSFMELYNLTTSLIGQEGRRGALMLSLDCSHPDIMEFIKIKSDLNKITKANLSVMVSDKFMSAVANNEDWKLYFERQETGEVISQTVRANDIYDLLCKMNWDYGEPGILFWDTIKAWSLLSEDDNFVFAGVNPCAEEPLPAGGSCLLGSLNLSEYCIDAFTPNAQFNRDEFVTDVKKGVVALNEVLHEGLNLHPLAEQQNSVNDWRQIGLGLFGWHDLLVKLGIKYGDDNSIELANQIGNMFANAAICMSADLTGKYGTYPMYNKEAIFNSPYFNMITTPETRRIVEKNGLANSQLLTIPPTGSIATMLGVSTALEPIYSTSYTRKTESLNGKDTYHQVLTPIIEEMVNKQNIVAENMDEYVGTTMYISYQDRIKMQATWQKYIDASISSTINVSNAFTEKEVADLYLMAWEKGLKGVTIFRDGCARFGILSTKPATDEHDVMYNSVVPVSRKKIGTTHGSTYCKKCACGTLYVTCNKDTRGNIVESFVHTSKGGICQANISAINRLISLSLRSGVKVTEIADQISKINCPACVKSSSKGERLDGISCPDILSKTLLEFANERTTVEPTGKVKCPECGGVIKMEGGCYSCGSCGYSKCE